MNPFSEVENRLPPAPFPWTRNSVPLVWGWYSKTANMGSGTTRLILEEHRESDVKLPDLRGHSKPESKRIHRNYMALIVRWIIRKGSFQVLRTKNGTDPLALVAHSPKNTTRQGSVPFFVQSRFQESDHNSENQWRAVLTNSNFPATFFHRRMCVVGSHRFCRMIGKRPMQTTYKAAAMGS
jgi:hypothetical protein